MDCKDAGYVTSNKPSQGEIYIRGGSVTQGYFKVGFGQNCQLEADVAVANQQRDDLTKEAFTEDKWFMTGDIGQWNEDGTLSIIDRKKVRRKTNMCNAHSFQFCLHRT